MALSSEPTPSPKGRPFIYGAALVFLAITAVILTRDQRVSTATTVFPESNQDHRTSEPYSITTRHSRERAQETAALDPDHGTGVVQLLNSLSRQAIPDTSVEAFQNDSKEKRALRSDQNGLLTLPPGTWRLNIAGGQTLAQEPVIVSSGDTQVVWVCMRRPLHIRLKDIGGAPIEGATALWHSREVAQEHEPDLFARAPISITSTSDALGEVLFEEWPESPGEITILAVGYERAIRHVRGPASDPITIYLKPTSALSETLSITDVDTAEPVAGALVETAKATIGRSDTNGIATIPSWVSLGDYLQVSSPEYATKRVRWPPPESGPVTLHKLATLRATIVGGSGLVNIYISSPSDVQPPAPQSATDSTGTEISIPRGVSLSVIAVDEHQNYDTCEVFAIGPIAETTLVLEPSGVSLLVTNADGLPLPAQAHVSYDETMPSRDVSGPGGNLSIPAAASIRSIAVSAQDHETVVLRPTDRPDSLTGEVLVTLQPLCDVAIDLLESSSKTPLAGMHLALWPKATGIRDHPRLYGGWPTSHPRWVLHRGKAVIGITDAAGTYKTQVPVGEYRLEISTPREHGTGAGYHSLYPRIHRELVVTTGRGFVFHVARPVFIVMEVFESASGLPVGSLQVGAGVVPEDAIEGNLWQGWIAAGVPELTVVAPGVGSARVSIPYDNDRLKVYVHPENSSRLVIAGLNPVEMGTSIGLNLIEVKADGRLLGFANMQITLDLQNEADVFLPYDEDLAVSIEDIVVDGATITFEPEFIRWGPGRQLVFTAHYSTAGE